MRQGVGPNNREDGGCHFRKWPVHSRNIKAESR